MRQEKKTVVNSVLSVSHNQDLMLRHGWRTGAIVPELELETKVVNTEQYAQSLTWLQALTGLVERMQVRHPAVEEPCRGGTLQGKNPAGEEHCRGRTLQGKNPAGEEHCRTTMTLWFLEHPLMSLLSHFPCFRCTEIQSLWWCSRTGWWRERSSGTGFVLLGL